MRKKNNWHWVSAECGAYPSDSEDSAVARRIRKDSRRAQGVSGARPIARASSVDVELAILGAFAVAVVLAVVAGFETILDDTVAAARGERAV